MTRIPHNQNQFELYVEKHLKKKNLSIPYLLNEFIRGQEFAANIICKNGQIYMFQVCPSSPIQTNYVSMEHRAIEKWVEKFVSKTQLSGLVCFDFLVNEKGEAYCIECNPRLHSAVVSFSTPKMVRILNDLFINVSNFHLRCLPIGSCFDQNDTLYKD